MFILAITITIIVIIIITIIITITIIIIIVINIIVLLLLTRLNCYLMKTKTTWYSYLKYYYIEKYNNCFGLPCQCQNLWTKIAFNWK